MCRVVSVKICEVSREADKHSFAVRMHKPLAVAMECGDEAQPCSTWYLYGDDTAVVQDSLFTDQEAQPF